MSSTLESLETEALRLSAAEREKLVERLIASLDFDPELESGAVALVPGDEALARLKAQFK